MNNIDEKYLQEANRIREQYLKTLEKIKTKEDIINKYKSDIENVMEKNTDYIEKHSEKSIDQIKENIKDDLYLVETSINKINDELTPLLDKIDELKDNSSELFTSIKDKYPLVDEIDIQEQVFKYINR